MNFALFILLNGILLIRPEELIPDLAGWRLYLIVITLCALTTLPGVLSQLSSKSLSERPITVCALGLLVAMALSHVVHGRFEVFDEQIPEFAKVLLYFFLLMAVVNSPERLVTFIGWIVLFVTVLSTLAVLQFHGYIDIEALEPIIQSELDPETGEFYTFYRLVSSGIYHDPNDLCLILVTGSLCCLCRSASSSSLLIRILWLCPIGWFLYSMTLTVSRGGFLGLAAGIIAYTYARFGGRKCLPLTLILVPVLLVLFGGRQTDISLNQGDTSQQRLQLWTEGISLMLRSPITIAFGIGTGQFADEFYYVAHNSFVEMYVETGLLGGGLFLGAFFLAVCGVWRARKSEEMQQNASLLRLQPFVFAMIVGYAMGAYSVSRSFVVPTYLILGMSAALIAMTYKKTPDWFRFNQKMLWRLTKVSLIGIVFLKYFTQSLVQYG